MNKTRASSWTSFTDNDYCIASHHKVDSAWEVQEEISYGKTSYKSDSGLYISYQPPLALASKETFFTCQQKNVTCQINKDTNMYYTTPICIYSWIIINALSETEDA